MELMNRAYIRFAEGFINKNDLNIPQADVGNDRLSSILSIVFGLLGSIAVIIIILAGIKFITSQGDPQATAKARNTIIYAAVGLAVSVAAFTIVTFVIGKL